MRNMRILLGTTLVAFLVAAASQALELKLPPKDPKSTRLFTFLSSEFGAYSSGWVRIEAKDVDVAYDLAAQTVIRQENFKELGIDPANGFEDEQVVLELGKTTLKMQFAWLELTGPVFTVHETRVGSMPAVRGDLVAVAVNGKIAATGKF